MIPVGHAAVVPGVLKPSEPAGLTRSGAVVGPGAGDNAAAALGVGAGPGDVIISIGTSGVVSAVADFPIANSTGEVINFADATGRFLRLATTPIAARVLDATAQLLGVEHGEFSRLALSVPAGSDGLVLLPYFEEASGLAQLRARGVVHGLAYGAARQAAWTLASVLEPPQWRTAAQVRYAEAVPSVRARFADVRSRFQGRNATDDC